MNKMAEQIDGMRVLNTTLWCPIIISLLLGMSACSKSEMKSVLDDIARDTYEANERNKYNENKERQIQTDEPLTYDQYQQEKKELIHDDM